MKRKLFLHIGAGKTGSSALQVWLHNNRNFFKKNHINYPTTINMQLNDYAITSGNGSLLINALRNDTALDVLKSNKKEVNGHILYSSEIFQDLTEDELEKLCEHASALKLEVKIIMFVRNIYEMTYSSYQQLVKRHLYSNTFQDYCRSIKSMQQFDVLEKYEQAFDDIVLLHYDSENKNGIEQAFLQTLNIKKSAVPAMQKTKVNRSLTLFETEILRKMNDKFKKTFNSYEYDFCTRISDSLIYKNPEAKSEILYNQDLLDYLDELTHNDIQRINNLYFQSKPVLSLFHKEEKNLVYSLPAVEDEYMLAIDELITYFKETTLERRVVTMARKSRGHIDLVNDATVSGWAMYYESAHSPIVELYVNEKMISSVTANRLRKDLVRGAVHPTGECGFCFSLPNGTIKKGDKVKVKVSDDSFVTLGKNPRDWLKK